MTWVGGGRDVSFGVAYAPESEKQITEGCRKVLLPAPAKTDKFGIHK